VKNNKNKRINRCHFLNSKYNFNFFYFVFALKYYLDIFLTGLCLKSIKNDKGEKTKDLCCFFQARQPIPGVWRHWSVIVNEHALGQAMQSS